MYFVFGNKSFMYSLPLVRFKITDYKKKGDMKKMKKILAVLAVLLLSLPLIAIVSACEVPTTPTITLSPPQGFAMTMITGTGFHSFRTITVTYDGAAQPTIPSSVKSDSTGAFTAIVAIPDELAVGAHTITANDGLGYTASATFTVVDMKGAQGPQGVTGQNGKDGANGLNGVNGADFNATGNIIVNNGTDGQNGLNGLPGINGLNGQDFNATGNVLVYNGTDGANGISGANGINGVNGANGINGKDGATGAQGLSGAAGSQGTLEKIVYVNPPQTSGLDSLFIAILVIALIALTGAITIVYRKTK
jgi:hypothetical protein